MLAHLSIGTSTESERLNLLTNKYGFHIRSWNPKEVGHEGFFRESNMADFRQMTAYKNLSVIDEFPLSLVASGQDDIARDLQDVERIVQGMIDYWAQTWRDGTVYIQARALKETNTRYAVVYDARLSGTGNPFGQKMTRRRPFMDELSLFVEHGPWLANAPGESECVEISGKGYGRVPQDTFYPVASGDDAVWNPVLGSFFVGHHEIIFGKGATDPLDSAIRFRNVTIPPGAIVVGAYLRLHAFTSEVGLTCNAILYGEKNVSPAQFTTSADFLARERTLASTNWNAIAAWTACNWYNTSYITDIIQEIIGLPGWASGNDVVIFIDDNGSSINADRHADSVVNVSGLIEELIVAYYDPSESGRDATCEDEVFIANKHNVAPVSFILRHDVSAATYTELFGTALPYTLLPGATQVNDAIYFGSGPMADDGPFCSLVFDLGVAQEDLTIAWEYWNGAWVALPSYMDHTDADGLMTGEPFDTAGVKSVHWDQPQDWVANLVDFNAAHWIRAIVTGVGAAVVLPSQQNRDVYTITWPYIDIAADQIEGDFDALARQLITGCATDTNVSAPYRYPDRPRTAQRLLVGARTLDRGELFSAYINLYSVQNMPGITISANGPASVLTANSRYPTGGCIRYTPTGVNSVLVGDVVFNKDISNHFRGEFHCFLRAKNVALNAFYVYLKFTSGFGHLSHNTEEVRVGTQDVTGLMTDLGRVSIPNVPLSGDDVLDYLSIELYARATAVITYIDFFDIILVPADELLMDFVCPYDSTFPYEASLGSYRTLDVDSIGSQKRQIRSLLRVSDQPPVMDGDVTAVWTSRASEATLEPRTKLRLWFLQTTHINDLASMWSFFESSAHLQLFHNDRYRGMRGDR